MRHINWLPIAVFTALAGLVLGPLLLPGYVLTLDMIFTPKLHYPLTPDNMLPFHAVMNTLNILVPGQILQKLLLLATFALAGLGMYRLVQVPSLWARYTAGLLYVINPFTYGRFMAGQYLVLLGYALMPWVIASLARFIRQPKPANALRLTAWLLAISAISIHSFGFACLAVAIGVIVAVVHYRHRPAQSRQLLASLALTIAAVATVSSYWLIPLLTGRSAQAQLIQGFDQAQLLSFATVPDPSLGLMPNAAALYGFWVERQNLFLSPKAVNPLWWIAGLTLLGLIVLGIRSAWRHDRTKFLIIIPLATIGFVLALGVMGSPFAPVNQYLLNLPLLHGYREPGKFIGLVALAYAYLAGWGANLLLTHSLANPRRRQLAPYLQGLLLALPLIYTPTLLWAAGGQLRASHYPAEWYALDRQLKSESATGSRTLFLPWHQYMRFDFAGRLIATPASRFFSVPIVQGDNAEIGLIEYQDTNPASRNIQSQILDPITGRRDLGRRLAALNIQYVILAKAGDYSDYAWLQQQPDLMLVHDTPSFQLYRNIRHQSGDRP